MSTPLAPSAFSLLRASKRLASQLEREPVAALRDHPTIADLPQAVWRNKRYVLEESLFWKGSKGRKSWIKYYGLFVVELDANSSPLNPYWACRLCDAKGQPVFFAATATTSAADHLRKSVHPPSKHLREIKTTLINHPPQYNLLSNQIY
jgi:hypothetical protein